MLIYLGRRVAVGFFASYDHGCNGGCGWRLWMGLTHDVAHGVAVI